MGIANQAQLSSNSPIVNHHHHHHHKQQNNSNSMSQDYHHHASSGGDGGGGGGAGGGGGGGFFSFSSSNGFERIPQEQHIAQQMRRDKLRVQAAEYPPPPQQPSLVGIGIDATEEEEDGGFHHHHHQQQQQVCETTGMLSEMFNFAPTGPVPTAVDLLDHHHHNDWYGGGGGGDSSSSKDNHNQSHHHHHHGHDDGGDGGANFHHHQQHHNQHQIQSTINADSAAAAAAMQLFLSNPPPRSPSPPPPPPPQSSSTLHMLLPDGYAPHPTQFSWLPEAAPPSGVAVEGQGLSLSLSSSLQHLEAAKAEELRITDATGGLMYYNHQSAAPSSSAAAAHYYKTISQQQHHQQQQQQQALHLHQQHQHHHVVGPGQGPVGFGSGLGVVNVLRSSKYVKAAAELLEEFCSVGRGQFKKSKLPRLNSNNSTNNNGGGGSASTPTTKESPHPPPPLSSSDRMEHQRRKVKLVSMLDEVDRRYNHYCEQMQMVVNSFDLVMGFGAAVPYTALAQKAMSRHFRCLKDAIAAQLRQSCELLGEKGAAGGGASAAGGITRGETPRLRALEQSLRQQRAFHQMGMMEQEAWRPQRGLPERSVNILRAWLFEHFLHPYPSDADKHLLARQTGLSRNQVSNWFINARVRLWKPMIEEMYQQESKEDDDVAEDTSQEREKVQTTTQSATAPITPTSAAAATISFSAAAATTTQPAAVVKTLPEIPDESDDAAMNNRQQQQQQQYFSDSQADVMMMSSSALEAAPLPPPPPQAFHEYANYGGGMTMSGDDHGTFGPSTTTDVGANALIRYGAAAAGGDVSLTLGLRHAGNMPEKASSSAFSIRDFGDC